MTKPPIVLYVYYSAANLPVMQERLTRIFRETGHDRELEFRVWNCYKEIPGEDADILFYDVMLLNSLHAMGRLRQLPDDMGAENVFPWVLDTTKVRGKTYGVPIFACSSMLIRRRGEDDGHVGLFDLKGSLVTPLKSMIFDYYLEAYCNYQDCMGHSLGDNAFSSSALSVMKQLARLLGGGDALRLSLIDSDHCIEQFGKGEAKYLLGFSEYLRFLPEDDYAIDHICLSHLRESPIPFYYTDFLSVTSGADEEKLSDCMDILRILTSEEYLLDICAPDGKPSYMLPVNETVFRKLAERYPVYGRLYELSADPLNCSLRFGANYYEKCPIIREALMNAVSSV